MGTKTALEKLNEKQLNYCNTLSYLIDMSRKRPLKNDYEKYSGKLRGFLECLCQMDVITGNDLKLLYLWFFSANRYNKEV